MAIYIPKSRLGSNQPQRRPEGRLTQRIEGLPVFQKLQQGYAEAKRAQQANLKEKFESNAEVQNWRRKNAEEKTRDAIERMVPTAKEVIRIRTGKEATHEEGRKYAENLAYRKDKE